jgi:hypothetical protein
MKNFDRNIWAANTKVHNLKLFFFGKSRKVCIRPLAKIGNSYKNYKCNIYNEAVDIDGNNDDDVDDDNDDNDDNDVNDDNDGSDEDDQIAYFHSIPYVVAYH